MRWDGYVEIAVSKIKLPGDVARRMKEPHVVALAESSDDLGGEFMHAPTVNADVTPVELVAGRDRMAATLLRKRKTVWVHVGRDWTPLDLFKAEVRENLHRRHDDKVALAKSLVDKAETLIKAEADVSGQTANNSKSAGRPKEARTAAREVVAEASGQSVNAVRHLDRRAQARESGGDGELAVGAVPAPSPPLIETFGHELPDGVAASAPAVVALFDKADKLLRQVQVVIGDLGMTDFKPGIVARLKQDAHDVAARVRAERPTHLCPYCLGKDVKCGTCQETRVVTKSQFDAAPEEKRRAKSARTEKAGAVGVPVHGETGRAAARGSRGTASPGHTGSNPDTALVSPGEKARPAPAHVDDDGPDDGKCAHAYRKGGVSTGVCLHCGAPGAVTWTLAEKVPEGAGPPPYDATDAGWEPHGPGSDRKVAPTEPVQGTPERHVMIAKLHAAGPCGCASCAWVNIRGGLAKVAPPRKKKEIQVSIAGAPHVPLSQLKGEG